MDKKLIVEKDVWTTTDGKKIKFCDKEKVGKMFIKKGKCYICEKEKENCTTVEVGTVSELKKVIMCKECWDDCMSSFLKKNNNKGEKK